MAIEPVIFDEHGMPVELITERDMRNAVSAGRLKPDTIVRIGGLDGAFVVRCARDVDQLKPIFGIVSKLDPDPLAADAAASAVEPVEVVATEPAAEKAHSLDATALTVGPSERREMSDMATSRRAAPDHGDGFWAFALLPLKRYADFEGRSRRKEYWSYALFQILAIFILLITTGLLAVLAVVALVIPTLAVTVRRLHDQDKSGWFVLTGFIPYIGSLILLLLMIVEGTPGPNRFGPDPRAARLSDSFN